MFAALERDHRAQHGKPKKQDRREFIRPNDRRVEDVAGQDAGKKHNDLCDHQQRRRNLNEWNQDGIDPGCPWGLNASGLPVPYHIFHVLPLVLRCSEAGFVGVLTSRLCELTDGLFEDVPGFFAEFLLPFLVEACLTQRFAERGPVRVYEFEPFGL